MPLKVKKDGVTIPKSLGRVVDSSGNEFHEHESYIYAEGDIVQDEDVSPTFLQKLEDGDAYTSQLVEKVSDDEAKKAISERESDEEKAREDREDAVEAYVAPRTSAGGDQPPWIDYEDLSERETLRRLKGLSAAQLERVKRWEREHGKGREKVLEFSAGDVEPTNPTTGPEGAEVPGEGKAGQTEETEEQKEAAKASGRGGRRGN